MSSEAYALGIDIGGTHLRMGLIRRDGTLSLVEKRPSADLSGGSPIALLESVISDYMCRNGVKSVRWSNWQIKMPRKKRCV